TTQLVALLKMAETAWALLDTRGHCIECSQRLADLLGRAPADLHARALWQALPECADALRSLVERALHTQGHTSELIAHQNRWIELRATMRRDMLLVVGLERKQPPAPPAAHTDSELAFARVAELHEVMAALGRALSPQRVAEIIVEQGLHMLGASAGSIELLDDTGETMNLVQSIGYSVETVQQWQCFPATASTPVGDAVRLRIPIWLNSSAERDRRYPQLADAHPRQHERSFLAVPLLIGDRVLGTLAMEFEGNRALDQADFDVIGMLAQQAAHTLEQTRLYQETQQALQNSEEARARLEYVLSTAPVGIALWDTELRYVHINPMLATLNRQPPEAHIGRTLPEVMPVLARQFQPVIERVLSQGEPSSNIEIRGPGLDEGLPRDWLASFYPVRLPSGRVVGVGALVIDITERKRIEAAGALLADVTIALGQALTSADALAVMTTRITPALQANAIWIARLGDTDQLEVVAWAGYSAEDTAAWALSPQTISAPFVAAVQRSEALWIESHEQLKQFYGESQSEQIQRALPGTRAAIPMIINGQAIGAVGLRFGAYHHYTDEEREFIRTVVQQFAQAYERTRLHEAEREARQTAEAAVKLRDQFLSVAAHELKTPLTSLMGNTQLLQRRMARAGTDGGQTSKTLEVIVAQSRRLNQLISALLDVARIQSGQLSIERAPCDLSTLVARVVAEIQPTLNQHQLHLSSEMAVIVSGDELRLEQVLQNLVQNAVKYSPHGGEISITLQSSAGVARLRVRDSGIGVPHTALPHLFTRFYRAENANPNQISGMGIGLYVVREIVQLHGGEVWVDSVEGQGSEFTVELPLA
ncbi:MAG: PAS domain-containing protein, partial [Roseiflexaceae bacterium]|nr:PAS domain-containing protein [Roseiflexaceae bacterium]